MSFSAAACCLIVSVPALAIGAIAKSTGMMYLKGDGVCIRLFLWFVNLCKLHSFGPNNDKWYDDV